MRVSIGQEFFAKEARNYSDMHTAFWRELFQNSIDAGASRIYVNVSEEENGVHVSFDDNGSGMDRDTLENVFFSLGNTTKIAGDTIGGYGKARIILCFAQKSYTIHTGNMLVKGSGGEYEIESAEYKRGCKFDIFMESTLFYCGLDAKIVLSKLRYYLSMCQLNTKVYINGELYHYYKVKRNLVRELSCGTVYCKKSESSGDAYIRVNGVLMFTQYIGGNHGTIIIELNTSKSREILTSNRDSLTRGYRDEFEKFIAEITVDTKTALRNDIIDRTTYEGAVRVWGQSNNIASVSMGSDVYRSSYSKGFSNISDNYACAPVDPITDGMVIIDSACDPEITKAIGFYDPRKWTKGANSRRKKVLEQWLIAVEAALDVFCNKWDCNGLKYRIGWYFHDSSLACHQIHNDDSHAILLNPICTNGDSKGKMRYGLRSNASHIELIAFACHEVAHVAYSAHNEEFASMFTFLVSETMKSFDAIHKKMIGALGQY